MRDATHNAAGRAPDTWTEAFNALPLERPDTDALPDILARLPVRKRVQWPARLAIAAALALAVIVPLRMLPTPDAPVAPPAAVATTAAMAENRLSWRMRGCYRRDEAASRAVLHLWVAWDSA